jgi:hypothetical protein
MNSFFSQAEAGVISDAPRVSEILLNVLQFLLSVVAIVAILSLVIAGIRYFFIRNTDQAEGIKKSITAIIIGLIVTMGSMIMVVVIGKFLQ